MPVQCVSRRAPRDGSEATDMLTVSAIVAVVLLGYLVYALVRPEKLG